MQSSSSSGLSKNASSSFKDTSSGAPPSSCHQPKKACSSSSCAVSSLSNKPIGMSISVELKPRFAPFFPLSLRDEAAASFFFVLVASFAASSVNSRRTNFAHAALKPVSLPASLLLSRRMPRRRPLTPSRSIERAVTRWLHQFTPDKNDRKRTRARFGHSARGLASTSPPSRLGGVRGSTATGRRRYIVAREGDRARLETNAKTNAVRRNGPRKPFER